MRKGGNARGTARRPGPVAWRPPARRSRRRNRPPWSRATETTGRWEACSPAGAPSHPRPGTPTRSPRRVRSRPSLAWNREARSDDDARVARVRDALRRRVLGSRRERSPRGACTHHSGNECPARCRVADHARRFEGTRDERSTQLLSGTAFRNHDFGRAVGKAFFRVVEAPRDVRFATPPRAQRTPERPATRESPLATSEVRARDSREQTAPGLVAPTRAPPRVSHVRSPPFAGGVSLGVPHATPPPLLARRRPPLLRLLPAVRRRASPHSHYAHHRGAHDPLGAWGPAGRSCPSTSRRASARARSDAKSWRDGLRCRLRQAHARVRGADRRLRSPIEHRARQLRRRHGHGAGRPRRRRT